MAPAGGPAGWLRLLEALALPDTARAVVRMLSRRKTLVKSQPPGDAFIKAFLRDNCDRSGRRLPFSPVRCASVAHSHQAPHPLLLPPLAYRAYSLALNCLLPCVRAGPSARAHDVQRGGRRVGNRADCCGCAQRRRYDVRREEHPAARVRRHQRAHGHGHHEPRAQGDSVVRLPQRRQGARGGGAQGGARGAVGGAGAEATAAAGAWPPFNLVNCTARWVWVACRLWVLRSALLVSAPRQRAGHAPAGTTITLCRTCPWPTPKPKPWNPNLRAVNPLAGRH